MKKSAVLASLLLFFLTACASGPSIPVTVTSLSGDYRLDLSLDKGRLLSGTVILIWVPASVREVEIDLPAHFDGDYFVPPRTGTAKGSQVEKPFEEDEKWKTRFHLKPPDLSTGEIYAGNAVLRWKGRDIFIGLWYGPTREKFLAAARSVGYSYEDFIDRDRDGKISEVRL